MVSAAHERWKKWRKRCRGWESIRLWRRLLRGARIGARGWECRRDSDPRGRKRIAKLSRQSRLVLDRATSVCSPGLTDFQPRIARITRMASQGGPMVIDSHAHVTAPDGLYV